MAINQKQIKINTLAKDFNMKSKEVIDVLAEAGMDKKTSGTIDSDEFAAFLNHVTATHQINNMSDYLSGKAEIVKTYPYGRVFFKRKVATSSDWEDYYMSEEELQKYYDEYRNK